MAGGLPNPEGVGEPGEDSPRDLWAAAYEGDLDALRSILAAGADPNALDRNGRSPLERAAVSDRADAARELLAAGAQVDARDEEGKTALMLAAWFGGFSTAKALLAAGADATLVCGAGRSALHYACADGLIPEARLLSERGGWSEAPDAEGLSPLDIAIQKGFSKLAREMAAASSLEGLRESKSRWDLWRSAPESHAALAGMGPGGRVHAERAFEAFAEAMAPREAAEAERQAMLAATPDPAPAPKGARL